MKILINGKFLVDPKLLDSITQVEEVGNYQDRYVTPKAGVVDITGVNEDRIVSAERAAEIVKQIEEREKEELKVAHQTRLAELIEEHPSTDAELLRKFVYSRPTVYGVTHRTSLEELDKFILIESETSD